MGSVNFYLKKREKVSKKSLIYLKFKYNGKVLVYSFGQSIDPINWSPSKQRVKSNRATTGDGQFSLNDLLDNLEIECQRAYNSEIRNGIPEPATLKHRLEKLLNKNHGAAAASSFHKLIERFIAGEIKYKGREKSSNTLKK
ncbi:MAG: Arm DNA-binding domain-containing protein [Chitinophagaceae bacterium]